jgi:hypothetical protein
MWQGFRDVGQPVIEATLRIEKKIAFGQKPIVLAIFLFDARWILDSNSSRSGTVPETALAESVRFHD